MYQRRLVALGIVALLAACGGGGGSSSPGGRGPLPGATTSTAQYAAASFTITIPNATAGASQHRGTKTVPSGTKSIKFTLLKTDASGVTTPSATPVYPLLSSSPGCALGQAGVSCTISLQAPVGTNIYLAEVFTTADGSGTHIGSGAVRLTVVANSTNSASLTLAGPIAAAYVATDDVPVSAFLSNGPSLVLSPLANVTYNSQSIPVSARVFVVALDAQGNQIISPDTFDRPVVLTLNYVQTGYQVDSAHRSTRSNPNATQFATLSTTYAFPVGGVTSASTSTANPTIQVLSPADQTIITPISTTTGAIVSVTASIGGVAQPLDLVYTILDGSCPAGDTGSPPFNCVPPTPSPAPSASPSPSPSPTPLMWPDDGPTTPPASDSAVYYPIGTYAAAFNLPSNAIPIVDFSSLPQQNLSNIYTLALTGGATMSTGGQVTLDASSCESNIAVSPRSPIVTNGLPIEVTVTNTAASAIGCLINASDGTTIAPLQIYVENHTVIVSKVKK